MWSRCSVALTVMLLAGMVVLSGQQPPTGAARPGVITPVPAARPGTRPAPVPPAQP